MKSRPVTGRAILLELTVVLFFFSLATGIIVRLFVTGREAASESAKRTDAMFVAQACAEKWLESGSAALEQDGFVSDGSGTYRATIDGFEITAKIAEERSDAGVLKTGDLTVYEFVKPLFSLPLGRYEASP